ALFNEAENSRLPWDVVLEVSHHGPFLEKPTVFIEIGSSEKQWTEKEAARVLAYAIMKATRLNAKEYKTAIGAGGTHYCPEFTKIQLKTDIALSHIVSKYAVDSLTKDSFNQMTEKTVEKVDFMLLDWKGLTSEQRQKMIAFCERAGIEYKKTKDFM
ncbi:D-aminoacyl-tRNA deacylase, partial [Candidatus Micrarchaeota archaeon]|nr:D-aminoacyl-tRNA deacylase [Candidatus Micrarchaeota archaeon]